MERLGELESLLFEIEEGDDKLKQTIIRQRFELNRYQLMVKMGKLENPETIDDDEIEKLKEKDQNILLRKKNKKLKKELSKLKNTISELMCKLNKMN